MVYITLLRDEEKKKEVEEVEVEPRFSPQRKLLWNRTDYLLHWDFCEVLIESGGIPRLIFTTAPAGSVIEPSSTKKTNRGSWFSCTLSLRHSETCLDARSSLEKFLL